MLFSEDDSPYPEVRSAVANTDDPTMPASTLRSWVIGLIFAIVISVRRSAATSAIDLEEISALGIEPVLLFPVPRCHDWRCEFFIVLFTAN